VRAGALAIALALTAFAGAAEQARYTFEMDGSKEKPGSAESGDSYEVSLDGKPLAEKKTTTSKLEIRRYAVEREATPAQAKNPDIESALAWRDAEAKGAFGPVQVELMIRFHNPSDAARAFKIASAKAVTDVNSHPLRLRLGRRGKTEWDGSLAGHSDRLVTISTEYYDDGGSTADIKLELTDSLGYSYSIRSGTKRIRKGDPAKDVHRTREIWKDERIPY
jgi:hypothetical protein